MSLVNALLSRFTVGTIGLTCKSFLNIGYCSSVSVNGLENLKEALHSAGQDKGCGVITVCNHISTLDDPVAWGILPARYFFDTRTTRWTLGASDIMFTNSVFSAFFRRGQVLETFRGKGIYQPAVDTAIEKLNDGGWIHLFGEGKVNQPGNESDPSKAPLLLRFKWGVGRILMEAQQPPIIIPMWLTGFDKLMPEGRSFPFKYFPRRGVALSVTFGRPISPSTIRAATGPATHGTHKYQGKAHGLAHDKEFSLGVSEEEKRSLEVAKQGWLGDAIKEQVARLGGATQTLADERSITRETARIRSALTAVLHREVEALGKRVLGSA